MKITGSNFEACLRQIAKKSGVAAGEAMAILQRVADRGDALRASGAADAYVKAAQELADRAMQSAKRDRLDALRNAAIRTRILADVDRNGGLKNAELTLRSILHGTNAGARDSVESRWKGTAAGWQAALSHTLKSKGLEKVAIAGELDRDVARELWSMNAGESRIAGAASPARAIAEAIKPLLDVARDRLNGAGARIGNATDFVSHTLHDPVKMRRAAGLAKTPDEAFVAWWKTTEPLLAEKTFADLVPRDGESDAAARTRFGRSVFDALVSGVHMKPTGAFGLPASADGFVRPAFEGAGNIARRVSQDRVLFWRDGGAWHDYMKEFGAPHTLSQGVMMALDKSARQVALMERFGTNPADTLGRVVARVKETYRADLDGVKNFQRKVAGLANVMGQLDGSANIPVNDMAARIASSVRTWESVSDLGGVGVTHFASIWPTVTSEMVHHGVSRLETLGNMIGALVKGRGSAERQEMLAQLGAYSHGLTRDMFARWQAEDSVPGRVSALANTFMKYTGIHYVFDNTQAAVRETLANHLARNLDKSHDALELHLAQMLGKYGIGEGEWDLLRGVRDLPSLGGLNYLTPKDALRVDAAGVEALLRKTGALAADAAPDAIARTVAQFRQSLADRVLSYYGDIASRSVVTAGVRERAAALGGTRSGTLAGEALRFLMQFKMWPLAAMNQIVGREIHTSLTRGEAAWNIGVLMALSAASGYLRMTVNDVATGRPIRDPLDPRTLMAGLAQGGGVGILGDFLFGEVNRMGGGLIGTLGGPVVSDADTLVKLFNRFRADTGAAMAGDRAHKNGHFADLWPDLAHFAVRHVPFANLVYLKGTLDYLVWYHLYEAASPGWWERTNRRLLREQGRPLMGYTPGGGVPFTPLGG